MWRPGFEQEGTGGGGGRGGEWETGGATQSVRGNSNPLREQI